jgi:superfamily I DNA/RNA helicase/mRNA-degrading endonuclease RelE of RelBE toxin-antitoxin system
MFFHIAMAQSFRNELLSLPPEHARQVNRTIDILIYDPYLAHGSAQPLTGGDPPLYQIPIGDYRLIYTVAENWVKLLAVRPIGAGEAAVRYEPLPAAPLPDRLEAASSRYAAADGGRLLESRRPVQPPTDRRPAQPITVELLERLQIPAVHHAGLQRIQRESQLLTAALPGELFERLYDVLFPRDLQQIHRQPELVVPQVSDLDRLVNGELIPFLLRLAPEQQELIDQLHDGPALVRGGPGSGKSIVALYRVRALVQAGRTPLLYTTFTTTLINYSRQLLARLLGCAPEQAGVTVSTVDAVLNERYRSVYGTPRIAGDPELLEVLERVRLQLPDGEPAVQQLQQRLGNEYLLEEFHQVIDGWGLATLAEYLAHERGGRRIALREAERRAVWRLYDAWWRELHRKGLETWAGMRRRALALVRTDPSAPYAAVVVDEAQDLSPTALRCLFYSVRSRHGVYLTADGSQSLYGAGFSWRQIDQDLRLRGRSRLLKRNYRNSAQIGRAAAQLLPPEAAAADTLAQEYVRQGPPPLLAAVHSDDDEADQIRAFLQTAGLREGLPLHAAAVLCHSAAHGRKLAGLLQSIGLPAVFVERQEFDLEQPAVKVMTLYAAKGLEFPLVVISRVGDGRLPFITGRLPAAEQAARLEQQRRLLYVGCTRAMRALLVCVHAAAPSSFTDGLQPPTWQVSRRQPAALRTGSSL